ncbi:hypothetical protein F4604DRAFT_1491818, partial [Suillus subluteus]
CQSFNSSHVAADCLQEHNTYRTCGANYQTVSCTLDTQKLYHCMNYNIEGHALWSQDCHIL